MPEAVRDGRGSESIWNFFGSAIVEFLAAGLWLLTAVAPLIQTCNPIRDLSAWIRHQSQASWLRELVVHHHPLSTILSYPIRHRPSPVDLQQLFASAASELAVEDLLLPSPPFALLPSSTVSISSFDTSRQSICLLASLAPT